MNLFMNLFAKAFFTMALLAWSVQSAHAREFKIVEERVDSVILVDTDQLSKSKQSSESTLAIIKFIQHWKSPQDFGLGRSVGAEEKLIMAMCEVPGTYKIVEHRFLAPVGEIASMKGNPVLKSLTLDRYEQAPAGTPEAAVIKWACTWLRARS